MKNKKIIIPITLVTIVIVAGIVVYGLAAKEKSEIKPIAADGLSSYHPHSYSTPVAPKFIQKVEYDFDYFHAEYGVEPAENNRIVIHIQEERIAEYEELLGIEVSADRETDINRTVFLSLGSPIYVLGVIITPDESGDTGTWKPSAAVYGVYNENMVYCYSLNSGFPNEEIIIASIKEGVEPPDEEK